jgi:hypothetical protein
MRQLQLKFSHKSYKPALDRHNCSCSERYTSYSQHQAVQQLVTWISFLVHKMSRPDHQAPYTISTGNKSRRGVKRSSRFHPMPRLRMGGAIPLLLHVPAWRAKENFIILANNQLDAQFFFLFIYSFISILNMFRETTCSSSGESIVSIQYLVRVTHKEWHIPNVILLQMILPMMSTRLLETCRELK